MIRFNFIQITTETLSKTHPVSDFPSSKRSENHVYVCFCKRKSFAILIRQPLTYFPSYQVNRTRHFCVTYYLIFAYSCNPLGKIRKNVVRMS